MESDQLTLQRWLREDRRKDHSPHYPESYWYVDFHQEPLKEVMEREREKEWDLPKVRK